jgi:hypothetical protein
MNQNMDSHFGENFISTRTMFEKLDTDKMTSEDFRNSKTMKLVKDFTGEMEVVPTVDAVLMSKVVNQDNLLVIGDTLMEVTYEYVKIYEGSTKSNSIAKLKLSSYKNEPITRTQQISGKRELIIACGSPFSDPKKRLVGRINLVGFFGLYAELSGETLSQRKAWYGWTGNDISFISLFGTGTLSSCLLGQDNSGVVNEACSDCDDVDGVFVTTYGLAVCGVTGLADHLGDNGTQVKSCTNNF